MEHILLTFGSYPITWPQLEPVKVTCLAEGHLDMVEMLFQVLSRPAMELFETMTKYELCLKM